MESGKSNIGTIVLTIIITAIVVGGGFYLWQENQPIKEETVNTIPSSSKQPSLQFETMDGNVSLVIDDKTYLKYETTQPRDVIEIDGNVTPDGAEFVNFSVWAKSADANNFYIKEMAFNPLSREETEKWYGPFYGDLKNLIK
jgi:hypothetical protein